MTKLQYRLFAILFSIVQGVALCAQTPVNGYARVTAIAGNVLTLSNVSETYDTFEDGEYVIVMQMQDNVLGNTSASASFGNSTATLLSAGLYEVAVIQTHTESASLPTTITVAAALSNTYSTGANSRVQVISYPSLGTPNYTSPASGINAVAWDGNTGGVVAFLVNGTLTLGGNITADGAGFRGGAKNTPNGYTTCDATTFATSVATRYAAKGEGIYLNTTAAYNAARGKMLNGGGGGNDVNAGGGGGGNYSSGGDGGIGWTPSGVGCSPGVGGLGGLGLAGFISGGRLFMGGGGGGGHENDGVGSTGGNGGGIILIRATTLTTGGVCSRSITANGATPANAVNDGSGGAGAGGTILLQITTYSITGTCPLTVSASGGNGGNSVTTGAHGGGGGGGQGAVIFSGTQPTTNVTTQTNAGIGGSSCLTCTSSQNGVGGTGPNNQGILTGNPNPLPVELLSFTGHANGNQVDLIWETASEINNAYFMVERSDVSGNTNELGRVQGAGTTSMLHSYAFTDPAPNAGVNYYRLRQVDFDGKVNYSDWIAVEFQPADHYVTVFPNPTTGAFQLSLQGYNRQWTTVQVTDITGRTVSCNSFLVQDDFTTALLDLSGENSGVYFVTVTSGGKSDTYRVIRY